MTVLRKREFSEQLIKFRYASIALPAIVTFVYFCPLTLTRFAIWVGLVLGLDLGRPVRTKILNYTVTPNSKLRAILVYLLGIAFFISVFGFVSSRIDVALSLAVLRLFKYLILGLWIGWGGFVFIESMNTVFGWNAARNER